MINVKEMVEEFKRKSDMFRCESLHADISLKSCHDFQKGCKTYVSKYWFSSNRHYHMEKGIHPRLASCKDCERWINPNINQKEKHAFGFNMDLSTKSPEEQFKEFYKENMARLILLHLRLG